MTQQELAKLSEAMDWVIPPDTSPGAGSAACVGRMVALIESQNQFALFAGELPELTRADLTDPSNAFARLFVEQVRDVYYAYPETGSWADIGFKVTDP